MKTAVQRGFWRERAGLIAKKWERKTKVSARLDDFGPNPLETGRFLINVTPEDADTIYVSEDGPPDPTTAAKLNGRVHETAAAVAWFLAVDSKGDAKIGDAVEWRAPIRIKPDVKRVSGGHRVSFIVSPRSAVIRATFDGGDPKSGPVVGAAIDAPAGAARLRAVAEVSGQFSQEETAPLQINEPGEKGYNPVKRVLKPDAPASMTSRFEPKDTAAAFSALDRLAKTPDVHILGGSIDVNGGRLTGDYITLRLGQDVKVAAAELDVLVKTVVAQVNATAPTVKLRLECHHELVQCVERVPSVALDVMGSREGQRSPARQAFEDLSLHKLHRWHTQAG